MRYHVNIQYADGTIIVDDEGMDFRSIEEAFEDARLTAGEMIGEKLRFGQPIPYRTFEVTGDNGDIVGKISLEDVIRWAAEKAESSG